MALVRPFRALRPPPGLAARVASPPYDVINTREARALASGNVDSFLRVARPEVDLAPGVDEHADEVYAQGARNLAELRDRGVLLQDASPRLYVYAQTMGTHRQVGLVGCVSVDEYDQDIIRKHEKTRADKEDDRTRHIDVLDAHDEPVFLAYRAHPAIDALVSAITALAPDTDLTTDDGIRHTVWVPTEEQSDALSAHFVEVPALYVADGHHRSAASSRVHAKRLGTPGEHDRFLAVLFPDEQLQILAYHRLVRDRQGRSPEALLAALGAVCALEPAATASPPSPKSMGFYVGGRWYLGTVREGLWNTSDPVASLDASLCQDLVLDRIFGITDPRRDDHVDFVGGIRGTNELERRVREEGWSLAIAMYPTRIGELLAVSDAGRLMPPKSTWFEPKLRSGLFVHLMG
ncbi:MAG: DUF1015 domain-containing protein [Deltaproteobacteria bacterium]|jgi:uncharacterized protein (DUF1015 family)|nr:DUF1015 domain-containing protein [Deltaproteobacteria bacterium]MBP6831314.1 DUF1015 domain-containing protein [Deltaproteobacteria bacterium]